MFLNMRLGDDKLCEADGFYAARVFDCVVVCRDFVGLVRITLFTRVGNSKRTRETSDVLEQS